jgi:sulfate adenylyltransferase subunit 2
MSTPRFDHLRALEAESIHILREVVAEFERPVMLYSIGKDSSVLLRLAQKALFPFRCCTSTPVTSSGR